MQNNSTPQELVGVISLGLIGLSLAIAHNRGERVAFDFILLPAAILYFLPWIISHERRHRNTTGVGLINLFFGWSLIGWVLALVWAVRDERT